MLQDAIRRVPRPLSRMTRHGATPDIEVARCSRRGSTTAIVRTGRNWKSSVASLSLCMWLGGCASTPSTTRPPATLQKEVTFTEYSTLSRNEEILRRIMTPLTFQRAQQLVRAKGQELAEQPIDLAKEKFAVYVPAAEPPASG